MKKAVSFLIVILSLAVNAQNDEKLLQKLANNRDYIQLSQLDMEHWVVDDYSISLLRAYTYSAMANYEKSNKEIEFVLGIDSVAKNPKAMIDILKLQADNYSKTYQYKKAAESYKKIMDNYGSLLGKKVASIQNYYKIYNALSEVKPLQVSIPHNIKIKTRPDKKGLPLVQVRTPKDSVSLIFDTGASFSVATKSVAERLGIRILSDSIMGGGSTGKVEYMSVGVADTLYLGDILYKNVVFFVLDDEKMTFPEYNYAANGTLGFPEMQILSAIKIYKNGILEIPENTNKHKSNMMFAGGSNHIIVQVNDTLLFQLDTGEAAGTRLFSNYYNKNKTQVEANGEAATKTFSGMGGSKEYSFYRLKEFPIKINTTTTMLTQTPVFTEKTTGWFSEYDGRLGQDVISKYDYMLLDFKNMNFSLGNVK